MRNTITITFDSDRELTEDEVAALMNAVAVQVEEPQVENEDPTNMSSHVDATYGTKLLKIDHWSSETPWTVTTSLRGE